jgi:hypothetical protein
MYSQENNKTGHYENVPPKTLIETIANFLIYRLAVYKLLPWEYGGSKLWEIPTTLWVRRHRKGVWIKGSMEEGDE